MQTTFITFEQLLKAKKRQNIENRKIILFHWGKELPITNYLEDYWQKIEKNVEKPEYIEYIHQHNELRKFIEC